MPLYHRVMCLHRFKLFHPDMSSFTATRPYLCTQRHTCKHTLPQPLPCSLPPLAVSLIYEMPLIWPKRLLRDLPPLSSLHLLHPSFSSSISSVTPQSKSEKRIAQRAIHRLDTLTNMLLSFFLLCALLVSLNLPCLHLSCSMYKSNCTLFLSPPLFLI